MYISNDINRVGHSNEVNEDTPNDVPVGHSDEINEDTPNDIRVGNSHEINEGTPNDIQVGHSHEINEGTPNDIRVGHSHEVNEYICNSVNEVKNYDEVDLKVAAAVKAVSDKIRKGLDELKKREARQLKKTKKRSCLQMQRGIIDACSAKFQPSCDSILPSDLSLGHLTSPQDRYMALECILWQQSQAVRQYSNQATWKCSFIAGCLRKFRVSMQSNTKDSPSTRIRWTRATEMINSIVGGLWKKWGPDAALVYEALACKLSVRLYNFRR